MKRKHVIATMGLIIASFLLGGYLGQAYAQSVPIVFKDEASNTTVLQVPGLKPVVLKTSMDSPRLVFFHEYYENGIYVLHGTAGTACEDNWYIVEMQGDRIQTHEGMGCYSPNYGFSVADGTQVTVSLGFKDKPQVLKFNLE